jgi:predicted AAA+ superfamily ATPase
MIHRTLQDLIKSKLGKGKAILISGPRQVGKTTMIRSLLDGLDFLFLDGDDPEVRATLENVSTARLRSIIGDHKLVFLDEAQRIKDIGITLKIITDQIKGVQILVSGSSALGLTTMLNEPLTGRKFEYSMLPVSWEEYEKSIGYMQSQTQLENRLLYGFYPDVINSPGEEEEVLRQLTNSYMFKDVRMIAEVRKSEVLDHLMQAIAFQIGDEVSYNEIAQLIGVDKNTVQKYIDLLCLSQVLFKVSSYSSNLRNELKFSKKIYFHDIGIRNAVINDFRPLDFRQDKGAIWENFLLAERQKQYVNKYSNLKTFFWRTHDQQEVDALELVNQKVRAFEFKWKLKKKYKWPAGFLKAYGDCGTLITKDNFREYVVMDK